MNDDRLTGGNGRYRARFYLYSTKLQAEIFYVTIIPPYNARTIDTTPTANADASSHRSTTSTMMSSEFSFFHDVILRCHSMIWLTYVIRRQTSWKHHRP